MREKAQVCIRALLFLNMSFQILATDRAVIMTHTALSNVGGEVLLQNAPLSLRCLQLHILLVEH